MSISSAAISIYYVSLCQVERLRRQVSQPIIHTNLVISLSIVN
jgi:hypothetical protein